ncbi:MAG TPA: DNA mismatch repair protein MutS [Chloroflexi bacterium]|nr:DNA mismatch repair protein MutS [Chloroflexota bacterium]
MKALLMDRRRDFDMKQPLPPQSEARVQDLELNVLFNAMANGDEFLLAVATRAVLCSIGDLDAIRYRQAILQDCLAHPEVVRAIYQIPIEARENKKKRWMSTLGHTPSTILYGSVQLMEMYVELLLKLRTIADHNAATFSSEGFTTFFAMIQRELDDDYFGVVKEHLKLLKFRNGVLISAELGRGNEGVNYVLRKPAGKARNWWQDLLNPQTPTYTYTIPDRDENGARALGDLKDRGLNLVANAVAQSADHIESFFQMLRTELAFYIGCLNLHDHLTQLGAPTCFPQPAPAHERTHHYTGLYDVCLALTMGKQIVGNDGCADGKTLIMITGANQGGKSTFLRSIGLAQIMMQCGMFTPATSFSANVVSGVFTHYRRKEDATMQSGKLDEELSRMSEIADALTPNALMLFNESFAATNEREGAEVARQIVSALLERQIKVFFVTHQFELARTFYDQHLATAHFLRSERQADGQRTFRLLEGAPQSTSYGADLYHKVFG